MDQNKILSQINGANDWNDDRANVSNMLHDYVYNIPVKNYDEFQQVFDVSEKPLYTRWKKFTRLSVVLKLFNIKVTNNCSDTSFTSLLKILHEKILEDNKLLVSLYVAKNGFVRWDCKSKQYMHV